MKNFSCLLLLLSLTALTAVAQKRPAGHAGANRKKQIEFGWASYYANRFDGKMTASGERYNKALMTCAHNSLAMGTWLKVTNMRNHISVIVRVTDRLHRNNTRLVDLSRAAASKLGYLQRGLVRVKIEILAKKPALAKR